MLQLHYCDIYSHNKGGRMKKIISIICLISVVFPHSLPGKRNDWINCSEQEISIVENKGPGLWEQGKGKKVDFIETLSLGKESGDENLVFFSITNIAVDGDLNIYVLDSLKFQILKFDKDGHFLWKAGREGQGPGEFQRPNNVTVDHSNGVAILDNYRILSQFDLQGNFQRTAKFQKSIRSCQFLPDERLLVNISVRGQPGIVAEYYSGEGEFIKIFPHEYYYGPKLSPNHGAGIGGEFYLQGNKIYLSLPDNYEIREYNLEGKLLRRIKRDLKLKPPNIIEKERSVHVGPSDKSGPCFIIKNDWIVNKVTIYKFKNKKMEDRVIAGRVFKGVFNEIDNVKRSLDFFNIKGQFLCTKDITDDISFSTVDHEGNFYFVQRSPFPRVSRRLLVIK